MIKRILKVVVFFLVYVIGMVLLIPTGLYWVLTGDERPIDYMEVTAEKLLNL